MFPDLTQLIKPCLEPLMPAMKGHLELFHLLKQLLCIDLVDVLCIASSFGVRHLNG